MDPRPLPRLRQVALVAVDLGSAQRDLEAALPVGDPFADPGVGEFGLRNAVYELGDTFVEIVSPVRDGTTAGRYLDRRGGDAGYMALLQVADTAATRARLDRLGVRTVWSIDLPDISGTHLHPRDVPGAIVSLDTPDPPASWRWGGPRWTGGARAGADRDAGLRHLVVAVDDPVDAAATWREVVGVAGGAGCDVALPGGDAVRFVPTSPASGVGIVEVGVGAGGVDAVVCGVRFVTAA